MILQTAWHGLTQPVRRWRENRQALSQAIAAPVGRVVVGITKLIMYNAIFAFVESLPPATPHDPPCPCGKQPEVRYAGMAYCAACAVGAGVREWFGTDEEEELP